MIDFLKKFFLSIITFVFTISCGGEGSSSSNQVPIKELESPVQKADLSNQEKTSLERQQQKTKAKEFLLKVIEYTKAVESEAKKGNFNSAINSAKEAENYAKQATKKLEGIKGKWVERAAKWKKRAEYAEESEEQYLKRALETESGVWTELEIESGAKLAEERVRDATKMVEKDVKRALSYLKKEEDLKL